jgi:hypothetical protein
MTSTFVATPFSRLIVAHARGSTGPLHRHWCDGIFAELVAETRRYVATTGLRLHDHVRAVHSSMAFGFNLFMPFRLGGHAQLGRLLGHATGRVLEVESVHFEFRGQIDVLGEWSRTDRPADDDKFTAADVAVVVREGGLRGVILIEVKLTEGGFTRCLGRESHGNRDKQVCESAAAFLAQPRRCYLTRTYHAVRDRRYWDIFARHAGSVSAMFPHPQGPCPFAGDSQQPMRNHALALGLVQAGEFDFAHFGLVHHDDNPDVPPHWAAYRALCADPTMLFSLQASALLSVDDPSLAWWPDWRAFMVARYRLPTPQP